MAVHFTRSFEKDDEGWWIWQCECGESGGPLPGVDDAADDYGYHRADVVRAEFAAAQAERARTTLSEAALEGFDRLTGVRTVIDEDDSDQAVTHGPVPEPPKRLIDEPDDDYPGER